MFRSSGLRFIAVGVLALVMFLPLSLVSGIIEDRARYSEQTVEAISREWGGAQLISGPLLVIPVTEEVTYDRRREAVDAISGLTLTDVKGNPVYEHYQETVTETRAPIFIYPTELDIELETTSSVRHRGIFEVPVYTSAATLAFEFDPSLAESAARGEEEILWDEARIDIPLSSNRSLRGEARLSTGAGLLALEPISNGSDSRTGITALTGDPRELGALELTTTMNGAQSLAAAATARTTRLTITSDWPDPSFFGSFLPDASTITEKGFSATWTVPHLARSLPQVSRETPEHAARKIATMQVRYLTPNDFYQKAWRAARYGILFIALTFLTILLLDRTNERPAHPVQYLMVGLAQSVFVLLMVAYAEQIGFTAAYALASGATIGLLGMFGATALKLGRRAWLLVAMLIAVYVVLFFILRSADYALLAGASLAFVALALTMWLTRNEDWGGATTPRLWRFRKPPEGPAQQVT